MGFSIKLTNTGIRISLSEIEDKLLSRSLDIDQAKPQRNYIYAHLDKNGNIFYIGKGNGRRAWSKERHHLWTRYVEKHFGGEYTIEILNDDLDDEEAEEIEAEWISYYSTSLVNWINMGRETDFKALDLFHKKRNANRLLIAEARQLEKTNLEQAAKMYIQAIETIRSYCSINYEGGLVGQLLQEEAEELGYRGEIEAIDRLSLCLIRLGSPVEAVERVKTYFETFPRDLRYAKTEKIMKRIEKAKNSFDPK